MSPKSASKPVTPRWLEERSADFWTRLQVYPAAVAHAETRGEYSRRARRSLEKAGLANLRHLCAQAGLQYRHQLDDARQLTGRLLRSENAAELTYLVAYLKRHQSSVVEYFDRNAEESLRSSTRSSVATLSGQHAEYVRPITKLAALYASDPDLLETIHYQHIWRRLPTFYAHESVSPLRADDVEALEAALPHLVSALDDVKAGESYDVFGARQITPTATVFAIHRKFPPTVRSDYQASFRLQHDFSTIAFSVDTASSSVRIKVLNRLISQAILSWVSDTLPYEFREEGHLLFRDYQPDSFESAILGQYDESYGIDLIQAEFRHTLTSGQNYLTIRRGDFGRSVRDDLAHLHSAGVLRIRSLSEVARLRVFFQECEIEITNELEPGGSRRFRINDAEIPEGTIRALKEAFPKVFVLPLEQGIDPTRLAMGPAEIYQYLLTCPDAAEIQQFHRPALSWLVDNGLLVAKSEDVGRCTNLACSRKGQVVRGDSATRPCETCNQDLQGESRHWFERDAQQIAKTCRRLLAKLTGGRLPATELKFESQSFHRLSWKDEPNRTICVFINHRVSQSKIDLFRRANFPLVVIHPQGRQRLPETDDLGVAHIGLPYLLAADQSPEDWSRLEETAASVVARLLRMEQERVLRTARVSHERMRCKPSEYNDRMFESDAFNVLRSVFPFTVKWGGGNRPDGFSSLAYFPDNNLDQAESFNWSYDAKYTESTYPFEIGEFRQIFDYVKRISVPKRLKSLGNRYDAHGIITNGMEESAMKRAAEFLRQEHRLGTDLPAFLLFFMRESFLLRLWERVREAESDMLKRRTYLPEFFVRNLRRSSSEGYVVLDVAEANRLVDEVLDQDEIERPVDADKLAKDIKRVGETVFLPRAKKT